MFQRSFGYRPNKSVKDAILKVKEYAEQGYTYAVVSDLSKYFDTINHELLINLLRKNVEDERVVYGAVRGRRLVTASNSIVPKIEKKCLKITNNLVYGILIV